MCLERVMDEAENPVASSPVTLEELDEILDLIAGQAMSSAPAIREKATNENSADLLPGIVRRLQSHEAKWLVHMIRKDYHPVEIPEHVVLKQFHFLMPHLLKVQNSVHAAIRTVAQPGLKNLPRQPQKMYEAALLPACLKELKPELNFMIQRPTFYKARSIKHCVSMAAGRTMSLERKYDGEYCQVHVDISKDLEHCIQIFSKSGRDSTNDRLALQEAIRNGLAIGTPTCKIKQHAIFEGELVAYSQTLQSALPFYHVRKHVLHGGRRIGCDKDSPIKHGEHLMIVFFDILLINDRVMIHEPHSKRREMLKAIVTQIIGKSQVVERQQVDFSSSQATSQLRSIFAQAIHDRWEALVLKGSHDPYISLKDAQRGIKFKKDYIRSLGDNCDLCIVAARRDPRIALDNSGLRWTHFYVACLLNKEEIVRFNRRPALRIVDCMCLGSLSMADIQGLNVQGNFLATDLQLDTEHMLLQHPRRDIGEPSVIFTQPLIIELMGAGFERPQTVNFYILRFPRKTGAKVQIHQDHDLTHVMSFNELQEMASASFHVRDEGQEDAGWIEKLKAADPKCTTIQITPTTDGSVIPVKSATTYVTTPFTPRMPPPPVPLFHICADEAETPIPKRIQKESMPDTPSKSTGTTPDLLTVCQGVKRKLSIQKSTIPFKRNLTNTIYTDDTLEIAPLAEVRNNRTVARRRILATNRKRKGKAVEGSENDMPIQLDIVLDTTVPVMFGTPTIIQTTRLPAQNTPELCGNETEIRHAEHEQWHVHGLAYLDQQLFDRSPLQRRLRKLQVNYTTSILEFVHQLGSTAEKFHHQTMAFAFIDAQLEGTAFWDLVNLFDAVNKTSSTDNLPNQRDVTILVVDIGFFTRDESWAFNKVMTRDELQELCGTWFLALGMVRVYETSRSSISVVWQFSTKKALDILDNLTI